MSYQSKYQRRPVFLSGASQWQAHYQHNPFGSSFIPDGGDVVQLLDGRELPIQEILGEIGTNLWLVDLGEIPSYAITPAVMVAGKRLKPL